MMNIQTLISDNERGYGKELRKKYGDKTIDNSNAMLMGKTIKQYGWAKSLKAQYEEALKIAIKTKDPASDMAQKACGLHHEWLLFYNPDYSKEYHQGLGKMYVADERFNAYYEKIAAGCAEFFRDSINIYCAN